MVRSPASDPEHAPRRGRCYKKTIAMVLRRKPISNLKFYMSTRLEQLGTKDERTNSVMDDPTWPWRVKVVSSFVLLSYGTYQGRGPFCNSVDQKRPRTKFLFQECSTTVSSSNCLLLSTVMSSLRG